MIDVEKVIRGLERCKVGCKDCPYYNVQGCVIALRDDALEAIKALRKDTVPAELEGGGSSWWYVCGECHTAIDRIDNYCRECGKGIDWGESMVPAD